MVGTGGESSPGPTVALRLPSANGFNLFEVGGVHRGVSTLPVLAC